MGDRLLRLRRARRVESRDLTPEKPATSGIAGHVRLEAGRVAQFDVTADRLQRATLNTDGRQTVRAIVLGRGGDLLADLHVVGEQATLLPARARRVVLVGEGPGPAILGGDPRAAATQEALTREPVGIEPETVLLALTRRMFAGHGCVVESHTALPFTAEPLDSLPGTTLLRAATRLTLHLPRPLAGSSLVLTVAPTVADPGIAVDGVRWRSRDAKLEGLVAVAGAQATTLVMSVESARRWALDLDFGPKWRLTGAHVTAVQAPELVSRLRSGAARSRVDDRLWRAPEGTMTEVLLEVGA